MSRITTSGEEATALVPSDTDSEGSLLSTRLPDFQPSTITIIRSLDLLVALSMTGGLIDSLFFYTDMISDKEKCILFDKSLEIVVCVLRTLNDFGCMICLYRLAKRGSSLLRSPEAVRAVLSFFFASISIIPFLQVFLVTFWIFPRSIAQRREMAMALIMNQSIYRLFPVILWTVKKISAGDFAVWAVMFCFYTLYFSQGFGVLWYMAAIQKEIECWGNACIKIHTKCRHSDLYKYCCSQGFKADQFVHNFCSSNTTEYGFGMFNGAHQSGVLLDTHGHSWRKILYGFTWGLQSLSSFGQNLEAGGDAGTDFFLITIILFGMLLFSFLIGIFQMSLKSFSKNRFVVKEKMLQDIEKWQPFQKLSQGLQSRIRECKLKDNWQKTNVVNLENMFNTLPQGLRSELTRELCLRMIKTVEEFARWSDARLEKLYNFLKPVYIVQRTYVIKEGDQISEMVFVVQGKLWTNTKAVSSNIHDRRRNSTNDYLGENDFYGKELLNWIQADSDTSDLPISPKTRQAVTNVEAFVLMAFDLKMFIKHEEATMARLFENEFPACTAIMF